MDRRRMLVAASLLGAVAIVLIGFYAGNNLSPDTVYCWATRGRGC